MYKMNVSKLVMTDYIVHEKLCNFRCQYCLGNDLGEESKKQLNSNETCKVIYTDDCEIAKTLNCWEEHVQTEIFQVSGGELFLIENIDDFLIEKSKKYEKVIILTNGYLLNEKIINKLANCKNIVISLSLDGHTLEMNSYRFHSEKIFNRIIENLKLLVKYNIPVFINSVLHDRNIEQFKEFLYYILNISENILVAPIQLRGEAEKNYSYPADKAEIILECAGDEKLIEANIISPEYMMELYNIMKYGHKSIPCFTSIYAAEIFHNGEVVCCPLNWVQLIGNIEDTTVSEVIKKMEKNMVYSLLTKKSTTLDICKGCISHYDFINLYLSDKISKAKMQKMPMFNTEKIMKKLDMWKVEVNG